MRFLASSGGLFLDFTIHDFDMARWLLGEEPVEVFARGAVLVDPRVRTEGNDIDTAMLMLRTASGKMCQISNTRRAVYGYDQRIEVFGSKGMLRAGNVTPTTVERSGSESTCGDNPWPNFQTRYAAAYAAELSSFIQSVERRKPSEVPPEDSRRVLLLCEAAAQSARSGKPIRVPKN
jgi:myo-inositol 2-dehydrogenase/D-chiro-inositol 1-dehydrogenase